jgi:arginine:ornithine antiporter / lysine permease
MRAAMAVLRDLAANGRAADPSGRDKDVAVGALAVAYALAMIYSGGLKFLLLSALLYAPGTPRSSWRGGSMARMSSRQ